LTEASHPRLTRLAPSIPSQYTLSDKDIDGSDQDGAAHKDEGCNTDPQSVPAPKVLSCLSGPWIHTSMPHLTCLQRRPFEGNATWAHERASVEKRNRKGPDSPNPQGVPALKCFPTLVARWGDTKHAHLTYLRRCPYNRIRPSKANAPWAHRRTSAERDRNREGFTHYLKEKEGKGSTLPEKGPPANGICKPISH
jgi:hypothetical protein